MTTSGPGLAPGPTTARRGGLLREHDFRLLWIGETTSALGTTISRLALPLVGVVTLQVSTFQVSMLTAASWVPWLVVGLPAGAWVDRLRRRPLMLACSAASFTLLLSVPIAAWVGMLTFGHMLVVALLTGVAGVFFSTAYQVYLPTVVAPEHLTEAIARLQGSESAARSLAQNSRCHTVYWTACSVQLADSRMLPLLRGWIRATAPIPAHRSPASGWRCGYRDAMWQWCSDGRFGGSRSRKRGWTCERLLPFS